MSKYREKYSRWMKKGIATRFGYAPWRESGKYQLNFMVSQGLKPSDKLLDIGCSILRGGVHFMKYLEPGNYYGFDKEKKLIGLARKKIIKKFKLSERRPNLVAADVTDDVFPGMVFDYMFAQSVFSHLKPDRIEACLQYVSSSLKKKFCATFHEDDKVGIGEAHGWRKCGEEMVYAKYPFSFFKDISSRLGLKVYLFGNWEHENWSPGMGDHKSAQKMLIFEPVHESH